MTRPQLHYTTVKRGLDLVGSTLALVGLAPVIGAVALTVRLTLGSPVLFVQTRPGKGGQPFDLLKFRSMLPVDPERGWVTDEERLTRFGRALRATSLDELPSLVNVIKGEMSLIGPRPLMMKYLPLYTAHQARRHEVRPGITGLAQVRGRNSLGWDARLDLDVEYVDRYTARLDASILAKTVLVVLGRTGVAAENSATVDDFQGSEPEDGLVEDVLVESEFTTLRPVDWEASCDTLRDRRWVYFRQNDAREHPIGFGRLTGVGTRTLTMSLRLVPSDLPNSPQPEWKEAVLQRLLHRAASYGADRVEIPEDGRIVDDLAGALTKSGAGA